MSSGGLCSSSSSEGRGGAAGGQGPRGLSGLHSALRQQGGPTHRGRVRLPSARQRRRLPLQRHRRLQAHCGRGEGEAAGELHRVAVSTITAHASGKPEPCQPPFQARQDYDDALSSGQQAFLLEEEEQSPDVFSMSLGSLRPGEGASIRLEYVTELAVQADDGLKFCLPAVLNPRYQPAGKTRSDSYYVK